MHPTRTFRSAGFRLALYAIPLFVAAGWLMLGFVYVSTVAVMNHRVDAGLAAERSRLIEDLGAVPDHGLTDRVADLILAERGSARLYRLLGPDGLVLSANFDPAAPGVPEPEGFVSTSVRRLHAPADTAARLLSVPLPRGRMLLIGRDLSEEKGFRLVIEESLAGGMVLTVLVGTVAGLLGGATILRRLSGVNRTAAHILRGDLHERVPVSGSGDEFDALARHFNAMLDRIEALMAAMREVTDNIAHELRTPLNRLRGRLELALLGFDGDPRHQEMLRACLDDTDSLLSVFEALLTIARIENGLERRFQPVDLAVLAADLVDYYGALAELRGIRLDLADSGPVMVEGDRHLLFQAAANILDNALKYTPGGGRVAVVVEAAGGEAALVVADNGPGIPPDKIAHVRKRFMRLDPSPQRVGTGLGLSVAEAIAHHHGGALALSHGDPGLRAALVLPRSGGG